MAFAGKTWMTRCTECDHTDEFIHRGVRRIGMIHGACGTCRKIVNLSWRRPDGDEEPKPIASVWDPMRNRTLLIFNCPHCDGQFMMIHNVKEDLKHCPKCQKGALPGLWGSFRYLIDTCGYQSESTTIGTTIGTKMKKDDDRDDDRDNDAA